MINLFRKLKISQKLLISSAAFALPIAVLLYFVIIGYNNSIYFSQKEIYGNELLKPLSDVLTNIEKHQNYSNLYHLVISNDSAKKEVSLDALNSEKDICESIIKESFSKLIAVNEKLGSHIQTMPEYLQRMGKERLIPEAIRERWNELADNWKAIDSDEANHKYNEINEDVISLIRYIGNKSNLILDPDLDSYYLMDISLLVMPMMQMKLNDMIINASKLLLKDTISKHDILKIVFLSGSIQDDLRQRIKEGLAISLAEDKSFYEESISLQKELPAFFEEYDSDLTDLFAIMDEIINNEKKVDFDRLHTSAKKAMTSGAVFWDRVYFELDTLLETRIEDHKSKRMLSVLISAIALVFAIGMVLFVTVSITRPLKVLEQIARNVAEGDIRQAMQRVEDSKTNALKLKSGQSLDSINPNDELLIVFSAIETMTGNLDSLLKQVQQSAEEVSESAGSISMSARDLESTIAQQVSSTNEVNATSKEISSTARNLAQTMNNVSEMVTNSSNLAKSGISNLKDIKSIMLELQSETSEISDKLELINNKTENISYIITKITKVANRTNLLSLNAAIEAEKAGEQGAGFSVVAREIRLLADETSVAALDIEEMITETQKAVKDGVLAVESYTEKTNRSSSTIASISEEMSGLIGHINELEPKFNSVNDGMQMQSEGADQIKEAMEQLNESAGYTKDALMKFRDITDMLSDTLNKMNNELSKFKM